MLQANANGICSLVSIQLISLTSREKMFSSEACEAIIVSIQLISLTSREGLIPFDFRQHFVMFPFN